MGVLELHARRRTIYLWATAGAGAAMAVLAALNLVLGVGLPFPLPSTLLLVGVGFMAVPGGVDWAFDRWRGKIDDALPTFLSDVTSNAKSGFSLTRSLEMAADNDYGPLTKELVRMRTQLSWGIPFEDVIRLEMRRLDSRVAKRTFGIVLEADRSGGKVEQMLEAIQRHTMELHQIEKEVRNSLRPFTLTTYIAVFIFLGIAIVMIDTFFAGLISTQSSAAGAAVAFAGLQGISLSSIKSAFFQIALVEAVIGGLGAGKLGEASFAAGIKHIVILVIATVLAFQLFVG
ncbi:MAG: type II secretion system F family protein [Nitrososphaerota archaeon]|nr:type II secretion system F family protein [Nitrososphaerota archaeon]MDG6974013.1 type II secretion system F family protein [Nitrososphaerota archaeon]MDG7026629.1 type II secretion system F family protein [Nitrososphaerota archaeon]